MPFFDCFIFIFHFGFSRENDDDDIWNSSHVIGHDFDEKYDGNDDDQEYHD